MKTFKHSGNLGDIIYALPTVIALGGGRLYVGKNPPGGRPMTDAMVADITAFLKTQPYLQDVEAYDGQVVDYDLDTFREHAINNDHLVNWHLRVYGAKFDLTKPWLQGITPQRVKGIVISNSFRYRDIPLDWNVLKGYRNQCVFVGLPEEYEQFKKEMDLGISYHPTKTILELARVIKGSRLLIANQSLAFALAEGMKHPRILEVHHHCPNTIPVSDNARIILTEKILKKTFGIKKSLIPF